MKSQVVLDSNTYDVEGQITCKAITPWSIKLSGGSKEYTDLSQVNAKEWKDGRGGIGLKREGIADESRHFWTEGMHTSAPNALAMLGPKVTTAGTFAKACTGMLDFESNTYAYGDNLIAKWNAATPAWDSKETGLDDPIDGIVVTDETDTYAVVSSATAAEYSADGTTWTPLTGCKGYLAVIDNRLCGFYGQTLNYSPRGNIDGTWATFVVSAYLGTVHRLFQGKLLTNDEPVLYLVSSEGLWAIDFWTQRIYKQEISYPPHTNAGHDGMYWNSYIWVATGPGIKKISPSMASDVGPDQDAGLPGGYQGCVYAMTAQSDWLIYAVNGGSTDKSTIFKHHGTIGGNQQIYSTAAINKPIRCVHYSPSSLYTNGRLWWGEHTGIKYCMMPDFNANPREILSYEFVTTSGKGILPIYRPVAVMKKAALEVRAITRNCTAAKKITVYYRTDNDVEDAVGTDWTSLGTFITSPLPTALSFASGVGLEYYNIQLGYVLETDAAAVTPVLECLVLASLIKPVEIKGWEFNIRATSHNSETILSNLATTKAKTTLVTFYPTGNTSDTAYYVAITNAPKMTEMEGGQEKGFITVRVEEIFKG